MSRGLGDVYKRQIVNDKTSIIIELIIFVGESNMKNKANAATITVIILNPVNRNIIIADIILLKTVLFLPQIFLGKTSQNKFSINLKNNPKIESSNIFMYHPIVIIQIILICPTTSALPRLLFSDRSSASSTS